MSSWTVEGDHRGGSGLRGVAEKDLRGGSEIAIE